MDGRKQNLKGSESRDVFKLKHKACGGNLYATDADLCLVSNVPPGTVAYLDYKGPGDGVTFAEVIQYNEWMQHAPVYIVEGNNPETGPFVINRYLGGDWGPEPPDVHLEHEANCKDWEAFYEWERKLRAEYHKRGGWRKLRISGTDL